VYRDGIVNSPRCDAIFATLTCSAVSTQVLTVDSNSNVYCLSSE
jgi:hypothetical protein